MDGIFVNDMSRTGDTSGDPNASRIYVAVHVCTRGTGELANWAPTRASKENQGVRSVSQI